MWDTATPTGFPLTVCHWTFQSHQAHAVLRGLFICLVSASLLVCDYALCWKCQKSFHSLKLIGLQYILLYSVQSVSHITSWVYWAKELFFIIRYRQQKFEWVVTVLHLTSLVYILLEKFKLLFELLPFNKIQKNHILIQNYLV